MNRSALYLCSLFIITCFFPPGLCEYNEYARGWGDKIDWVKDLEEAKRVARIRHHPVMVIIHKKWCGACQSLKSKMSESEEFAEASKDLIMVNLEDDMEPEGREFAPDGAYIPRILFLDHTGEVRQELYNKHDSQDYKYYYSRPEQVIETMAQAVQQFHIDHLKNTEDTREPYVVHDEV